MKGNGDGESLGVCGVAKADVTPLLADGNIAKFSESTNQLFTRDDRQFRTHRVTTTVPISTLFGSGISSPRLSMSSRQSSMASRMFARASETVLPCE